MEIMMGGDGVATWVAQTFKTIQVTRSVIHFKSGIFTAICIVWNA